jgi:hypothetical protein
MIFVLLMRQIEGLALCLGLIEPSRHDILDKDKRFR